MRSDLSRSDGALESSASAILRFENSVAASSSSRESTPVPAATGAAAAAAVDEPAWKRVPLEQFNLASYDVGRVVACQKFVRARQARNARRSLEKFFATRALAAGEILAKERTYVASLDKLVAVFLRPLVAEKVVGKGKASVIFSNVEELATASRVFLDALESRMKGWNPKHTLSDVVVSSLLPCLSLYGKYCSNHPFATALVRQLTGSSEKFAAFLERQARVADNMQISSFLIKPIQRIPQYQMLFERLYKYTPAEHGDYLTLQEVLSKLQEVADIVDEGVELRRNMEAIIEFQKKITGNVPANLPGDGRRVLIHEGVLTKQCRKVPKPRYFALFTDLLLYGDESLTGQYKIHRWFDLADGVRLEFVDDNEAQSITNAFKVTSKQKSFLVWTDTAEAKTKWAQAWDSLKRGDAAGHGVDSSAPFWMNDSTSPTCLACDAKFTLTRRRHHCRRCGKLVCDACSSGRANLPNIGVGVRVCDECYTAISDGSAATTAASSGSPSGTLGYSGRRRRPGGTGGAGSAAGAGGIGERAAATSVSTRSPRFLSVVRNSVMFRSTTAVSSAPHDVVEASSSELVAGSPPSPVLSSSPTSAVSSSLPTVDVASEIQLYRALGGSDDTVDVRRSATDVAASLHGFGFDPFAVE